MKAIEQCACGRAREGCEFHDPAHQPVEYDTEQQPLRYNHVAAWPRPRGPDAAGAVPLDLAECDARAAAAGGVSMYSWKCIGCLHAWGRGCMVVWASYAWCPKCSGGQP